MGMNRTPPLVIQEEFPGRKVWYARVLNGNGLIIDMGSRLTTLERGAGGIHKVGQEGSHIIYVYFCEWELRQGKKLHCSSNQKYEKLVDLMKILVGRVFVSVSMESIGVVKIKFDDGFNLTVHAYCEVSWKKADFLRFMSLNYTWNVYRKKGFKKKGGRRLYETVLAFDDGPVPDFLKKIVDENQWDSLLPTNKEGLN
jgi:hypothetical protein